MRRTLLLVPLLVVACGTPQERCINGVTRDMRVVDRLIATSEGNLRRGYALEEVTVWRNVWVPCPRPRVVEGSVPPPRQMCRGTERDTDTRPRAINLTDEAELLQSLKAKRTMLARQSAAAIAQCKAQFPESPKGVQTAPATAP